MARPDNYLKFQKCFTSWTSSNNDSITECDCRLTDKPIEVARLTVVASRELSLVVQYVLVLWTEQLTTLHTL